MAESRSTIALQEDPLDSIAGLCSQTVFYEKVQQRLRASDDS